MSLLSKLREFFSPDETGTMPAFESESAGKAAGPLSARQIELVQSTWRRVEPIADQAASLFYDKLFELDPSLKALFANASMDEQKLKLMQMISVAVNGLERLDSIVPAVQALGKRHVDYHVQDDHYDTVAAALLWTLEQGLGEAFTPEAQEAWTETYMILANTMKDAAAEMSTR